MSITDELMKYAQRFKNSHDAWSGIGDDLTAIADRIDERYHRDMATAQQVGINEGEDAAMRDGWVELPKDADGVPIHVGDELEDVDNPSSHGEVHRIELTPDACWVFVNGFGRTSNHYRHYRAPTVEDVLREFGKGWYEQMSGPETFDIADYVERYAAKLQLREDKWRYE